MFDASKIISISSRVALQLRDARQARESIKAHPVKCKVIPFAKGKRIEAAKIALSTAHAINHGAI